VEHVKLTVLGCSGSYPGPGGAGSSYLVQSNGTNIWVDAGPGSLANLQRHIGLDDVTAIVLSHEHPDHWHDIEGYFVAVRYGDFDGPGPRVLAPDGIKELMYFPADDLFDWTVIADGSEADVAGIHLTFARTDHAPETLAVRFDADGKSLAYTADTGANWSLEALGAGLDLALCEATFFEEREGSVQHMSGRQAGLTAKAAGVARLMITHVWPTYDPKKIAAEAAASFGGPVEIAVMNESTEL
jgi:ribonuclease BN (tRNA processing enzyme)